MEVYDFIMEIVFITNLYFFFQKNKTKTTTTTKVETKIYVV